jgi:uncharacterized protein
MKIHVIVKTKSRIQKVEKIDDSTLAVSVREMPIDGKANTAVIHALSEYYSIPKNRIRLTSGTTSKHKYFSIDN